MFVECGGIEMTFYGFQFTSREKLTNKQHKNLFYLFLLFTLELSVNSLNLQTRQHKFERRHFLILLFTRSLEESHH